jgi:hypothetical protein
MDKAEDYKQIGELFFKKETDDAVCRILSTYHNTRERVRIFYGSEGRIWLEEHDVLGTIGRSTGTIKIPLLIKTSRSFGGGAILDPRIVRVQDARTKRVLFQKEGYALPEFKIRPTQGEHKETHPFEVLEDGRGVCARFKSEAQAIRYVQFMKGERMSK